jgi:hypothetical protein
MLAAGPAQTPLARGIPALAVSQGVDNGQPPNLKLPDIWWPGCNRTPRSF